MATPKHSTQDAGGVDFQAGGMTVGSAGVDLRVAPRNRSQESLEELKNASWRDETTFGRRHGHVGHEVYHGEISYVAGTNYGETMDRWVMGHGTEFLAESMPSLKSLVFPYPGKLQGVGVRGDELVAWTGDRLFTYPDGNPDGPWTGASNAWIPQTTGMLSYGVPAVIPTSRASLVPTSNSPTASATTSVDSSVGHKYHVVAHRAANEDDVVVEVLDRVTHSLVYETTFTATGATSIRSVFSAGYHMVYWVSDGSLHQAYASEYRPSTWTESPDTPALGGNYDLVYVNKHLHLLVWITDASTIKGTYYRGPVEDTGLFSEGTVFDLGAANTPVGLLAAAVAPNGDICLMWGSGIDGPATEVYTRVYTSRAVPRGAEDLAADITTVGDFGALACAAQWLPDSNQGESQFIGYCNNYDGDHYVTSFAITGALGASGDHRRYHCYLASRAFRTGQNVSVWLSTRWAPSFTPGGAIVVVETTNLFLITGGSYKQQVCGFADVGQTYNLSLCQPSVWPDPIEDTYGHADQPNTRKWVTASLFREATAGFGKTDVGINLREIDMLPDNFRTAQYGKSMYIAGAAVREWDGVSLVEAGTGIAPYTALAGNDSVVANQLTPSTTYNYRVYLTWKNAQGEISRSPAISRSIALDAGSSGVVLTTNTIPCTDKVGARFEYYRTEGSANGTTYYYVGTSDDVNDYTTPDVVFTDTTPDSSLITAPADPYNPAIGQATVLYNALPRGCEVILSFNDRLWLAGGEIPAGVVDFSKLQVFMEQAGFNDLVGSVIVDPSGGRITSLGGMADVLVAFTADKILLVQGPGPDNFGNGSFFPSSQVVGHGATTHEGTVSTENGLLYWSAQGPLMLTKGLQVQNYCQPIAPLASTLTPSGCVAPKGLREVRWYTRDGRALLWDYQVSEQGRWAVWTGLKVAGVVSRGNRLPELGMTHGFVYAESADVHTDNGGHYTMSWKHGQLRPGELALGDNRVRKVGLLGKYKGPHTLRCWVYYDGGLWYDQAFSWDPSTDVDLGVPWTEDDTPYLTDEDTFTSPDGVYRFTRRLRRGAFSTISFRFSDGGATNDTLVPHELSLDMADKPGLNDVGVRTFISETTDT